MELVGVEVVCSNWAVDQAISCAIGELECPGEGRLQMPVAMQTTAEKDNADSRSIDAKEGWLSTPRGRGS